MDNTSRKLQESEKIIPAESGHFYTKQGTACYEIPCTSKDGTRPTHIGDGRKLDLVASVTFVLNAIAKPGLEAWKATKILEASMTLPMRPGEVIDDYAKRVIADSKAEGIAAAERGTQLHKAIELYIGGHITPEWKEHLIALDKTLEQHGIDLHAGEPERSFAASIDGLWYGGKIDYNKREGERCVLDFKSKDRIEPKKQMVFDEHVMQLGAYGFGLFNESSYRGLNVFVGVNDNEIRVHEHSNDDLRRGFEMFTRILDFWHIKNRYGKYAKS